MIDLLVMMENILDRLMLLEPPARGKTMCRDFRGKTICRDYAAKLYVG